MTKAVPISEKWKYKELSDDNKKNIKMALASYISTTGQAKKFPAYKID